MLWGWVNMKKWFVRNKYLLISFGITSVIFFTLVYIQLSYVLQPEVFQELENYIETGEITQPLVNYSVLALISLVFFGIWAVIFVILLWKIIFPTKKSVHDAFLFDNYKYLYNLPREIRKGLNKYEQ